VDNINRDDALRQLYTQWLGLRPPTAAEAQRWAEGLQQALMVFAALGKQLTAWVAAEREKALHRFPPGTDPARLRGRLGIVWELAPAEMDGAAVEPSISALSRTELQTLYDNRIASFPAQVPSRKDDETFWRGRGVSRDRWRELRHDCKDPRLRKTGRRRQTRRK
jgi:hypothetical protein